VFVSAAAITLIYFTKLNSYKSKVNEINISGVELSQINDGIYTGECDVDFIRAKVLVTVKGGRLQAVVLVEHYNGKGESAEQIIGKIIEKQTLEVDNIAGATNSSKVIKKAIENALHNQKVE